MQKSESVMEMCTEQYRNQIRRKRPSAVRRRAGSRDTCSKNNMRARPAALPRCVSPVPVTMQCATSGCSIGGSTRSSASAACTGCMDGCIETSVQACGSVPHTAKTSLRWFWRHVCSHAVHIAVDDADGRQSNSQSNSICVMTTYEL